MNIFINPGFEIFPVLSMAKISVDIEEVDITRIKQIVREGSLVFTSDERAFNKAHELIGTRVVRSNKSKGTLIPYQASIVMKYTDRIITDETIIKWFVLKSN